MGVIQWNESCYRTNPFAHFLQLLDQRGFARDKTRRESTEMAGLQQAKLAFKKGELEDFDPEHEKNKDIIELLCVPKEQVMENAQLIVSEGSRIQHFQVRRYLTRSAEDLDAKLELQQEVNSLKVTANANKCKQLQDLMQACGCSDKLDINPTAALTAEESVEWKARLKVICPRAKLDKLDMTQAADCGSAIRCMMSALFGKHRLKPCEHTEAQKATGNTQRSFNKIPLLTVERRRVNKVRVREYAINPEFFESHAEIMRWSNRDMRDLKFDWGAEPHNRNGPPAVFRQAAQ